MSENASAMLKLLIPGRPVPAVRMTQNEVKMIRYGPPIGKPKLLEKYERITRYLQYKESIAWVGKSKIQQPLSGQVGIKIYIFLSGGHPGDWDNYGKAICDGLNKIVWNDDRQIKSGAVEILPCEIGRERAEAEIWELTS